MPTPTLGRRLPSLLHLLIALLTLKTVSQHRTPEGVSQRQEESRFLSSENMRDVREFRKRLHTADLGFARNLLRLLDAVQELKHGSDDPERVEERRIELETIAKGDYREGTGWVWNGHVVPPPESTSALFERRKRIIRNGVWNPARKGWEYQSEFFGIWE